MRIDSFYFCCYFYRLIRHKGENLIQRLVLVLWVRRDDGEALNYYLAFWGVRKVSKLL